MKFIYQKKSASPSPRDRYYGLYPYVLLLIYMLYGIKACFVPHHRKLKFNLRKPVFQASICILLFSLLYLY